MQRQPTLINILRPKSYVGNNWFAGRIQDLIQPHQFQLFHRRDRSLSVQSPDPAYLVCYCMSSAPCWCLRPPRVYEVRVTEQCSPCGDSHVMCSSHVFVPALHHLHAEPSPARVLEFPFRIRVQTIFAPLALLPPGLFDEDLKAPIQLGLGTSLIRHDDRGILVRESRTYPTHGQLIMFFILSSQGEERRVNENDVWWK
ncbi:hypothetical protein EVAR_101677_1 [Eumeta japonica]|uniref:Uncharacterized protein n=1 Tax=Eumeta variegata TaxID=151549 RepID=A0A4C1THH9_EUMVA|nr:hypothetical protein EVAR_101677_1 [Eumeta japonica]